MQWLTHDGTYAPQLYVLNNDCRSFITHKWIVLLAHIQQEANGNGVAEGPAKSENLQIDRIFVYEYYPNFVYEKYLRNIC